MNIANIIDHGVQKHFEKTAIIFEDKRLSYRELEELTSKVANHLLRLGLKKGDVVSLFLPSIPELIISYLGIAKAGMVVNVINAMLKSDELKYILGDSSAVALFVDQRREKIVESIKDTVPSLKHTIFVGRDYDDPKSFAKILKEESGKFSTQEQGPDDLCHLMYTSGTTGFPKGVMASHLNIIHNAKNFGQIHFNENDIIMVAAPLFHCWGLVNGTLGMLTVGGTVIIEERFQAEKVLVDIEMLKPTIFMGVPTMYNYMVKSPEVEKRDTRSLRFVLSAATSMPVELIKLIEEKLRTKYAEAYGLTEVSCVATTAPFTKTRYGSCGHAMGDTQLKVMDENGKEVPLGGRGELWCKGTAVTKGYLNNPKASREIFDSDGWFHTGDIAVMDKDGYVYIVDRKKDMINVGGEKVFPREVEEMMFAHPQIKDVAIVGIRDEIKGEKVKAFLVLKDGEILSEEEILSFCKEKMASYKVPKVIEFVDQIPRSASGKTLKRFLREH